VREFRLDRVKVVRRMRDKVGEYWLGFFAMIAQGSPEWTCWDR